MGHTCHSDSHMSRVQPGCPEMLPLLALRPVPASSLVCVSVPLNMPFLCSCGTPPGTRAVFYTLQRPDGPSPTMHSGEVSGPFDSGHEWVPTGMASVNQRQKHLEHRVFGPFCLWPFRGRLSGLGRIMRDKMYHGFCWDVELVRSQGVKGIGKQVT